jgi:signal transduction histidine kinase
MTDSNEELKKVSGELEQLKLLLKNRDEEIAGYKDKLAGYEKTIDGLRNVNNKVFSILSHDLRSPFNGLLGFANILVKDLENFSSEQIKEFADNIMVSARALLELIDDLFNWAKLERGDSSYKAVNADIWYITDEIFFLVKEPAAEKSIELINKVEKGMFAYTDLYVLKTVMQNLIYNAVKFTNPGGTVKVNASVSSDEKVTIYIEDNGTGITPQAMEKLFKPNTFFTTRGTTNEKGSGLGLVLCSELLKRNNGTISVDSEPGKGSIFKVTLPAGNNQIP